MQVKRQWENFNTNLMAKNMIQARYIKKERYGSETNDVHVVTMKEL